MTGSSDRIRATLLTVVVVVSVAATPIAFGSAATAEANNLEITSAQPVAGDGTVTVTMTVSDGANASFMVADSAGATSSVRTVTDDGPGDALDGTPGKVEVTLDLSTLFSSIPASGGGMVYGNQGDSASTGAPKSRELDIDSSPPTVSVGGSSAISVAAGDQIDIPYSLEDVPASSSVTGAMQIVAGDGTVVHQFSDSVQTGTDRTAQTTLPSDIAAGTYDVRLTATDAVGHTTNDTWTDGLTVSSTTDSSATATNPQVLESEPIKGTGTMNVSADLASSNGNNITFVVEDGSDTASDGKTVTDGGTNDLDGSADGTVTTSLDLAARFGSHDVVSDAQARLLVAGGDSVTVGSQDAKEQFSLDASPPSVVLVGGGSASNPVPVYTQSGNVTTDEGGEVTATAEVGWTVTDDPQKYANYTLTVNRDGNQYAELHYTGSNDRISTNTDMVTVNSSWPEGEYNLSIRVVDEAGYTANDTYEGGLVVDNTQPYVVDSYLEASPSSDEGGQMIVLDFASGPIASDSVTTTDFNVTVDTRTLPENATGVKINNLNVTLDNEITITPGLRGTENLTDQTRSEWTFESPTVHLNSSEHIADVAGNELQGPHTWANVSGTSGAPQNPDEIYVSPTPVHGDDVDAVTVSVNFTRTRSGENGDVIVGDPPQPGTIYVRFTGPSGNTTVRSMPANTDDSLTSGTFDLTESGLQDGSVTVESRFVDDDGTQNPDGWVTPTTVDMQFPPSVASMNVSNTPIDAVDANSSQTVTVSFTEQMDTDVAPTVEVTGLPEGSVPVTQTAYQDATWTGTVDLPQGVDTTATLEVSNATGSDGASLSGPATSSFRIDSDRPADPVNVTFADNTINASEMDAVGVNVTFDGSVDAETLTLRFDDGTQTVTRTVNVSASDSGSGTFSTMSTATTVDATVNLTNSGLNGSVTASAQVTDSVGNVNPSGYTATSTSVEFQADSSGDGSDGSGGDGSGGDSGGSGTVNLPAPSDVSVANAPLDAADMHGVPVTVAFSEVPTDGSVEVTFADETTTFTQTVEANTSSTTTRVTADISSENFTDGQLDVSARIVDSSGNESDAVTTTAVLDTTGPEFSNRAPAAGATAGLGLDAISVDVADAGVGVNASALKVSIEDGDADDAWDVEHATVNSDQVTYENGTLTYVPSPSFEGGNVTVHVTASDTMGHQTETQWNVTSTTIEQLSIDAVEHHFVGVVQEPDESVTVSAVATGPTGSPIQSTSNGTFELALTRNGSQVAGTQTVSADASAGTIDADLTKAITGTPEAGPVNVTVSTASGDAVATTTVNLTHKVVAFDQTWELMGTPMPVRTLHTSGVANFYSYSPGSGYESGVDPTQAGVGYYAERDDNATTARVGYTFETASRTTFGNQTLEPGWNLVGASFDVDAKNGVAVEKDLAPTQFDDPGVVVYAEQQGDLHLVTSGATSVGEFDGYFVYVSDETTRVFAVESYQPEQDQQSTA